MVLQPDHCTNSKDLSMSVISYTNFFLGTVSSKIILFFVLLDEELLSYSHYYTREETRVEPTSFFGFKHKEVACCPSFCQ